MEEAVQCLPFSAEVSAEGEEASSAEDLLEEEAAEEEAALAAAELPEDFKEDVL